MERFSSIRFNSIIASEETFACKKILRKDYAQEKLIIF